MIQYSKVCLVCMITEIILSTQALSQFKGSVTMYMTAKGAFHYNLSNTLQCRSKGNISGGARKCWRREPLEGSGGMLPQKNLTSRDLEMLFPAFSKSYL